MDLAQVMSLLSEEQIKIFWNSFSQGKDLILRKTLISLLNLIFILRLEFVDI